MNKKAQSFTIGFVLLTVLLVFILVTFAIIDPFKETLDDARDTDELNCPGTTSFDATDYANDTTLEKLTRRPTCFVTGISMVWFIGAFLIAATSWVVRNWKGVKRR